MHVDRHEMLKCCFHGHFDCIITETCKLCKYYASIKKNRFWIKLIKNPSFILQIRHYYFIFKHFVFKTWKCIEIINISWTTIKLPGLCDKLGKSYLKMFNSCPICTEIREFSGVIFFKCAQFFKIILKHHKNV